MSDAYAHPSQLRDVWLSAVSFEDHAPSVIPDDLSYGVSTEVEGELVEHGHRGDARLDIEIQWWDAEGMPSFGPFSLTLQVTGEFWFSGPTSDLEGRRSWLEFNSLHMLWPYARAYVGNLTAASKHQPLTLFTMQVPRPRALEHETQDFEQVGEHGPPRDTLGG